MRIGIYGGTFDPIHFGHLLLAESCRDACRLDRVIFVPARVSPHKLDVVIAPVRARLEMLELALAGFPEFRVSRVEVDRQGPSFTVDTLRHFRTEVPDDELFLLMGADSVTDFPRWREPQQILELATLVVVNRARAVPDLSALADLDTTGHPPLSVPMPGVDFSASDIRRRVQEGRSVRFQLPRPVEHYVRDKRLYAAS
ncbi:nicotinate-nucleotide adenylyltransferase [Planctomyces sp. SH-PL14]|uniref:nicotinate-nucleotide adenylyltransferase n=1 Tax=Planctomyces sp. SH-PL14 TaxID=1632864 RepID=UPI0009467BA4|nr:nicotinate-nucleotide adenylyltransferase [Planctomyces sp. SH-PL14]